MPNRLAMLEEGYEHLSYPLGNTEASDRQVILNDGEKFMLHKADDFNHAKALLSASDEVARHASMPIGMAANSRKEVFLVCHTQGMSAARLQDFTPLLPKMMGVAEKKEFCLAVIRRLTLLHTDGFGCGGLMVEKVVFVSREAKLIDPSDLFALDESDSLFYEAAATIASLVAHGFASHKSAKWLSSAYYSSSPVCRAGIMEHLEKNKENGKPAEALSRAAMRARGFLYQ